MAELKPCPFALGDIVYILGKYHPCGDLLLFEAKIEYIKQRQFVAHRTDGEAGEWLFSKKHFNKAVFKDKEKAIEAWNRRAGDG